MQTLYVALAISAHGVRYEKQLLIIGAFMGATACSESSTVNPSGKPESPIHRQSLTSNSGLVSYASGILSCEFGVLSLAGAISGRERVPGVDSTSESAELIEWSSGQYSLEGSIARTVEIVLRRNW